jgi:hypothetical protein
LLLVAIVHPTTASFTQMKAMAIGTLLELLYVLGALVALWLTWRALEWAWLSPRRLGRALRAQGLRGTSYRFPSGDLAEEARLLAAERAKPMSLMSHGISGRVNPLVYSSVKEHGTCAKTETAFKVVAINSEFVHGWIGLG